MLASAPMRTALERGASTLPARRALREGRPGVLAAPLALGVLAALGLGARIWFGEQIVTPFILVDELIHSQLAESFAETGRFAVRGEPITVTFLYPLLLAPAWLADSMESTYSLAKALNAVLMTLTAIPLYLWGRRFLTPAAAAIGAGLALLMPTLVLTGTLMQENAALPTFVLAAFTIALALERPTTARQLIALAAIALASATRVQALLLLAILPTAVGVNWLLDRSSRFRRFWPSAAAVAAALAGYGVLRLARGEPLFDSLGVYHAVEDTDYAVGETARWLAYNAGELALSVGLVPLAALAICLAGGPRDRAEQAFLSVAAASTLWLVLLAGVSASWNPVGIKERYAFYCAPLLFLALLLWIARELPRPPLPTGLAFAVPVLLIAALPLQRLFESPSFLGNAFGLVPFWRLSLAVPGGADTVKGLVVAGALAAAILAALAPRRVAAPALPALLAVFLVACSVPLFASLARQSRAVRDLAGLGEPMSWVEAFSGPDAEAVFVSTAGFEPDTRIGSEWERWVPVWQTELWNRSLRGVVTLGTPEPSPLHGIVARLDWATGRIRPAPRASFAVIDRRFEVVGTPLARTEQLALHRVQEPLRLASATEGLYRDGTTGTLAAYDRWSESGRAVVHVSGTVAPATVTAAAGRLELAESGLARLGAVSSTKSATLEPGNSVALRLDPPPPPFRIELRLSDGGRGARVSFRFLARG